MTVHQISSRDVDQTLLKILNNAAKGGSRVRYR